MNAEAISPTTLRIIIAVIGVVILVGIYLFGRRRPRPQRRRLPQRKRADARIDPVVGAAENAADNDDAAPREPRQGELDVAFERELERLQATVNSDGAVAAEPPNPATAQRLAAASVQRAAEPLTGRRPQEFPVDRIVTLYVIAPEGETFGGSDIVVAAEKAGLRYGAMHIFHRLVDGRPDAGPIFSLANMLKPGYFDMARIAELKTPGLTFFATLPGPLPALDAWDAMLPAAQRMAKLLGGNLLDEDRSALGRQRIAGLRDDLRAWDRQHEGEPVQPPARR